MFKLFSTLAILFAFDFFKSDAQSFTRCGLVWELRRQGFPEDKMRDWVCLIEHESGRNVKKIGPMNKDGSYDYGLFQINDYYWCNRGKIPGKGCSVTCAELLSFLITKACDCAKIIYNSQGFLAWYKWRNYCQKPEDLPDISSCN